MALLQDPLLVSISFHRGGDAEKHGTVEIALEVNGRFEMTCQRCLDSLAVDSKVQVSVWVAGDEATARALESHNEVIVSAPGERLDIASLVEDEVLLALPFAPRHALGDCTGRDVEQVEGPDMAGAEALGPGSGGDATGPAMSKQGNARADDTKPHPFAVLATLRNNTDGKD